MVTEIEVREFADKAYNAAACSYDTKPYITHCDMVHTEVLRFSDVFLNEEDLHNVLCASYTHDCIEDARLTYSDILSKTNKDIADITLAVTDVPAENRLLRHLLTMPKTIRDYRAIILKLADIAANAKYSRDTKSSMYRKYCREYQYRRPIFLRALMDNSKFLDYFIVPEIFTYLDVIHKFKS
jgi:(p)ppGpp synthase/HD superfamily hydrolase